MNFKLPAFLLSAVAISACVDIPDFSDTPTIYYNSLSQFTQIDTIDAGTPAAYVTRSEMVVLSIRFEDGDGDLGVSVQDVQNPAVPAAYANVPGWGKPANFEVVTMTKQPNGSWQERVFPADSTQMFPVLKPDGKPGPIKGVLDMYISHPITNSQTMATRRYKVRVIDRAYHISNQVEVPEIDAVTVPILRE
ncbi:MAG TPA: hypothetical protein VGN64_09670 [Dyadobacter sp.]|jgi:hypothetical protein|nr:hypothetical protein [Dyadobacter sp.]